MNKLKSLLILALYFALAGIIVSCTTATKNLTEDEIIERAKEIHENTLLLDTHVDIEGEEYGIGEFDPGIDNPNLSCDLVKMEKGKVDGVFLVVFIAQRQDYSEEIYQKIYHKALGRFTALKRIAVNYPDKCELAYSPKDIMDISARNKKAIMIGMENGYPIGDDITLLQEYYDLGTRYITLCHWDNNQICDAATAPVNRGQRVTDFGKEVIQEMNRLGMMCDASHMSEKSYWDLIEYSKAPIILSHSGCYALTPHVRNITDEQLKALTKNGGVIQIDVVDNFLESREHRKAMEDLRDSLGLPDREIIYNMSDSEKEELKPVLDKFKLRISEIEKTIPDANINDYINHIDYAVKVAGIDHVGIGTDFDGGAGVPGFKNHAEALNVTVELVRRGYTEDEIRKIYGENLLRVWGEVEKISVELKKKQIH